MMHFTSVDLPAPFSPSSAWNVPAGTLIETLSSARNDPKVLLMPTVSSDGPRRVAGASATAAATALMAQAPEVSTMTATGPPPSGP